MVNGLLGKKLGMTQIFDKEGNLVPVTIVTAGPCQVLEVPADGEAKQSIRLGYAETKPERLAKPQRGYFAKKEAKAYRYQKEFKNIGEDTVELGQEVKVDLFQAGDFVDVAGVSKGKGFQGGMKKHGWMGGPASHGSMHHRRVGSIGASAYPSKTVKGRPMPGQMGNERVTTQGLRVMKVDVENNLLLLKGAVPGGKNGLIEIKRSFKKKFKSLDEVKTLVKKKVNPMKQSKAKAKGK